jgi:hypothetical protein
MQQITINIPDEAWPRVAAAYHGIYPDNQSTPDVDLVTMALTDQIRGTWLGYEQAVNQMDASGQYQSASDVYSASRQEIDNSVETKNAQVQADVDAAFPQS